MNTPETETQQPVQWKVGDIFAPVTYTYSPNPFAIVKDNRRKGTFIAAMLLDGEITISGLSISTPLTKNEVTELLTMKNARKIGELTWNILV